MYKVVKIFLEPIKYYYYHTYHVANLKKKTPVPMLALISVTEY